MWTLTWVLVVLSSVFVCSIDSDVLQERNSLIQQELQMMLGSDIVLSDSEEKANEIIMDLKLEVLDDGFKDPGDFNLSKHFFDYKDAIKSSVLYKIIKAMPKGAILHAHDTGILSPNYVVELTYLPHLYVCFESTQPLFLFSETLPNSTCETQWQLMKEARYSSGNVEEFDAELRKYFTIVVDDPKNVYTDINVVWRRFEQFFMTTGGIFHYKPVWEQYFYDALKTLKEDNVMYIEIRSVLPQLYDLKGNVYDTVETALIYSNVLDQFMIDHPDFSGAKLIYAPLRLTDRETVKECLRTAKELKRLLPNFFIGFDLVGQEDLGKPLKNFIPELEEASKELNYYFHAGETNWNGDTTDENLFDAVVLKTKRIGHAFAIVKHPVLLEEVKKREIALEVNVVSNMVLKLVDDIRNHPLAQFLAQDFPVVLSSDDPGVWEADPLSHDFYVAFVGVASRRADLRVLKKLALNSIIYSAASDKDKMLQEFDIRWTKFVDRVVRDKW